MRQLYWWAALVLTTVLIGAVGYKAWPLLFPRTQVQVAWNPSCDLRAGPCESILPDGGRVSFEITPHSLPLVQPLQLRVGLEGVEASRVAVDFTGVDMNMGFNRVELRPRSGGGFVGQGILPVCVRRRMEWQARVLLESGDALSGVDYRFWTAQPGGALP